MAAAVVSIRENISRLFQFHGDQDSEAYYVENVYVVPFFVNICVSRLRTTSTKGA